MSDKQPLLKATSKLLDNEDDGDENITDNKKVASNSFADWRQCFNGARRDSRYQKIDDETKNTEKYKYIGIAKLFRHVDNYDIALMAISFLFVIIHAACVIGNLALFGKITGIFAIESFDNNCHNDYENLTTVASNLNDCLPGIELNAFNYERLHKFCHNDTTIVSSTIALTGTSLREKVMVIVHWLLIIGFVLWAASALEYLFWTISVKRQTTRMNILLFESLLQRKIEYLDTNPSDKFNSNLFTNITTIEKGIGFEFFIIFGILLCMVFSLTMSFFINWELSLIMSFIIPIVITGSVIFSRLVASETENELRTYSKAGHIVQEVFSSVRTVFSLNGTKFERQRYEKELDPTCWSSIRKGAVYGVFNGWLSLTTYLVFALGFIFGSILMSYGKHEFNLSNILIVVIMFAECVGYFGMIGPFFQSLSEARGAAVSVFQLTDEGHDPNINEKEILAEDLLDEESIPDIIGDIQFDNVNLAYISRKDVTVLKNLNFIARSNQRTALVGSSGSGKSTCMSLLLRLYEPSSGRITIDGRPITDFTIKQLRKSIGVVSQEPILFGMSIYENIRLGKLNATRKEIEEAAREANAHNFIMKLPDKYETLVGERGIQMSGGEKQRIALARALVKQPSILLLDEATSALDNVSEKIVQEALDRACKNRTTIVIAHRLSTIQNADQIYVLDRGSVIEEGKHEILMTKEEGKYQTMVKKQQMQGMTEDNDYDDDRIIMERISEQDDPQMAERNRLLSEGELVDMDKRESISPKKQSIFLRLLSMNSSEWLTIVIACVACLIAGICQPLFAILLAEIIHSFKGCHLSNIRQRVLYSSLVFFFLGVFLLIIRFLESTAFAIAGSKLIKRIRAKAFACLLRQEVAYFDRPENSSGTIGARLSSGAAAIQDVAGVRLGVICEAFALTGFGVLFGLLFNVQLTVIIFLPMILLTVFGLIHIYSCKSLMDRLNIMQGEASALAADVLQNMRTVKQLSAEKEMLRRYSEIIHKALALSCKSDMLTALFFGIYWATDPLMLGFLYWRALILVENGELDTHNII
ncbi:hypothetical protein I4U23_021832 [Adineta vaga]|nr:hypothetical protein I4U23_021832 [Adineta vaga]